MDGELVAWSQLAVPCNAACNPIYPKLQLHVSQAATLCIPGCNPMHPRLQPYASQASSTTAVWSMLRPVSGSFSSVGARRRRRRVAIRRVT